MMENGLSKINIKQILNRRKMKIPLDNINNSYFTYHENGRNKD